MTCKDCKERVVGCHATCDKYKEFRHKIDEANHKRNMANIIILYKIQKSRKRN